LLERGVEAVRQNAMSLSEQLRQGLATIDGVRLYGPEQADARVGIVSITIEGCDPHDVAAALDAAYRVQTRAGLHCAGRMHESLGTLAAGGTLRFSVGPFNTSEQVERAVAAVQAIAAGRLPV
jgi:selenocysteine lyase/cysteine desulfurase